jgi:hypothetical protein
MPKIDLDTVNKVAEIVAAVFTVLAFFVGGATLLQWYTRPRLVYSYSARPEYDSFNAEGLFTLIVENRGRAPAHQVVIKVSDLGSDIAGQVTDSEETAVIIEGGKGHRLVRLQLQRIMGDSTVWAWIYTESFAPYAQLYIASDQGRAEPAPYELPQAKTVSQLALTFGLGLLVGVMFTILVPRIRTARTRPAPPKPNQQIRQ